MTAMLEIGDLHVSYGQVEAVRGVSLDLQPGQIISVIGPNGAGKTTLLAAAMGLLPCKGTLRFEGEDLQGLDVEARVERGLCLVPEKRELFGELTVLDNLQLGAYAKRLRGDAMKKRLQSVYDRFPRLAERWNTPADYLSGGEQQMVAVARALAGNVQVLLLDEPFEGLSPAVTQELFEVFDRLRQEIAMVIVDHHLDLALALSDRTVVLERGSVIWSGVSTLLKDDLDLRRKVLWL